MSPNLFSDTVPYILKAFKFRGKKTSLQSNIQQTQASFHVNISAA